MGTAAGNGGREPGLRETIGLGPTAEKPVWTKPPPLNQQVGIQTKYVRTETYGNILN